MSDDMTLDDLTMVGIDGIRRSFDEHYDTMMCVEQDPTGAHHAIHNQHARIEELEAERDKAWKTCLAATTRGMELEAKLSIAVEALEYIKDTLSLYSAKEALDKIKGEQP